MRIFIKLLLVLLVLGGLGAGGWFGYNLFYPQYTIVRTFKPGQAWEYHLKLNTTTPGGSVDALVKTQTKVVKLLPNGKALLESRITDFKLNMPGQQSPMSTAMLEGLKKAVERVEASSNGEEKTINAQKIQTGIEPHLFYPLKPVRKGREWERKVEIAGGLELLYKGRIVGVEKFKGRDAYKITSQLSSLRGQTLFGMDVQNKGRFTLYIDRATGWLLHQRGMMETSLSSPSGSLQTTMNLEMEGKPASSGGREAQGKRK